MNIIEDVAKIRELNRKIKALKLEAKDLTTHVKSYMGESEELHTDDGELLATWFWHDVARFNGADLKSERPELYDEYLVINPQRKFLLK